MKDRKYNGTGLLQTSSTDHYPALIVGLSIGALLSSYFLLVSTFETSLKTSGFLVIVTTFLVASLLLHFRFAPKAMTSGADDLQAVSNRQLQALDDAHEFFAGSLNFSDSFRLVASRVHEMIPFRTVTLYLFDEGETCFRATESEGPDAEHRRGRISDLNEGAIARSYFSQVIEIDHATTTSRPAVAIPLKNGGEIFAVLHLDFELNYDMGDLDLELVDAIGTRSAPLVLSSMSYEQGQENALKDSTTALPNERAFFLVLENQVAEAQRKGNSRPLTILALDVRAFDEINNRFGHTAGDRVLAFVGQIIRDNLRQMDFLARASADEFVMVLPTASREISHDVIARIQAGFFGRKIRLTDSESVEVELNVGWAAFGTDGETPETLLRVARERKDQSKTAAPNKVIWFPTEYAS